MHPAIVRQRVQLDTLAHEAAAADQPDAAELVTDLEPWWPCTCGLWHRASESCSDGVVVTDG